MISFGKYVESKEKVLWILRGISGSGKSTLAQQLGQGGSIFSTDDFWMQNGEYKIDPAKGAEAHAWNQKRAIEAIRKGISPIVIDNTNIEAWESKPYVTEALKHGYDVRIKETETPWRFNADELTKRNKHGTPKEIIQQMIDKWHHNLTVNDILHSQVPDDKV